MTTLHFLDEQNQEVDAFASPDVASLLANNGVVLSTELPTLGIVTPFPAWNPPALIDLLQGVETRAMPIPAIVPGTLHSKRILDLTDIEKAQIAQEAHRDYMMNDEAWVEFAAPEVQSIPIPAGYEDLGVLIATLKRARNESLQMLVVEA
jgi:hypothetical protein